MTTPESIKHAPPMGSAENEVKQSPQDRLTDLTARATALYSVKKYEEAAELYSQATEVQAELNGEMAVENADLLYLYGRCLFYVAQKTSTVLGGTAASAQLKGGEKKKIKKKSSRKGQSSGPDSLSAIAETAAEKSAPTANEGQGERRDAVSEVKEPADAVSQADLKTSAEKDGKTSSSDTDPSSSDKKPFFQFTGDDENWDDSEDEDEDGEGADGVDGDGEEAEDEGEDEEDDDFATAYELLDLARILFLRSLSSTQQSELEEADKGKYVASIDLSPHVKEIKTRIADILDLQAEINLEGEKFSAAVADLSGCLALKEELESPESSILAECHYKLSLALEAASQDQERDSEGNPVGEITIDDVVFAQAIEQQEKAIECCKLRVTREKKELEDFPSDQSSKERDRAMAQIEDVQSMIGEMEDRLVELRKPRVSVKEQAAADMRKELAGTVLGELLTGGSVQERKDKLAEVVAGANDLSGMVKKKKPMRKELSPGAASESGASTATAATTGKRKVGFADEVEQISSVDGNGSNKRARVEEVEDPQNGV